MVHLQTHGVALFNPDSGMYILDSPLQTLKMGHAKWIVRYELFPCTPYYNGLLYRPLPRHMFVIVPCVPSSSLRYTNFLFRTETSSFPGMP